MHIYIYVHTQRFERKMLLEIMENIQNHIFTGLSQPFHSLFTFM